MKTKIFTGVASEVEAELSNYIDNVENFQIANISITGTSKELVIVLLHVGELPEKKGKK
jgi:hypothetical protein